MCKKVFFISDKHHSRDYLEARKKYVQNVGDAVVLCAFNLKCSVLLLCVLFFCLQQKRRRRNVAWKVGWMVMSHSMETMQLAINVWERGIFVQLLYESPFNNFLRFHSIDCNVCVCVTIADKCMKQLLLILCSLLFIFSYFSRLSKNE